MKIKLILTAGIFMLSNQVMHSQSLLGKLVNGGGKKKEPEKVAQKGPAHIAETADDFKDEFGYSGQYFSLDTLWQSEDQFRQKRDMDFAMSIKLKFVREEEGNVVNKLFRYYGDKTMDSFIFKLNEKALEKSNQVIFVQDYGSNGTFYLMMLEKDVLGLVKVDAYKNLVIEYINTYAKDKAKLAIYDKETGAAKTQQILNEAKLKEIDAKREKWNKNETYTKMAGKIGFIDNYTKVAYNLTDIKENVDVFMASVELGKQSIFYRAYFKTPASVLCAGCEVNTTYEIDGIKVSRVGQRKKSSKWSANIKQKFAEDVFFTGAPSIVSFQENIADYAFLYCLYQNKEKLVDGKSLKMKVTITTNQEGVDKDVLAEGTLTLVYKAANKAGVDKMLGWVESLLEE